MPDVPSSLKRQLAPGGRLVIPIGERGDQRLVRVRRTGGDCFARERLTGVRFVPLIGAAGWEDETATVVASRAAEAALPELVYDSSEHFAAIDRVNLDKLLQRIGDSRVVLLGEASHGTAEFYEMRARITGWSG